MKRSDIIFESFIFFHTSRGEAAELLCDLAFELFEDDLAAHNGHTIDALLVLFDNLYLKEDDLRNALKRLEDD